MTIFDANHPRVAELVRDGYMAIDRGHYIVTARGIKVLLACADRPIDPQRLVKPSVAIERWSDAVDRAREAGHRLK